MTAPRPKMKEVGPVEDDDIAARILIDDPNYGTCVRLYIGGYVFYLDQPTVSVLMTALVYAEWPKS